MRDDQIITCDTCANIKERCDDDGDAECDVCDLQHKVRRLQGLALTLIARIEALDGDDG